MPSSDCSTPVASFVPLAKTPCKADQRAAYHGLASLGIARSRGTATIKSQRAPRQDAALHENARWRIGFLDFRPQGQEQPLAQA
jgi:hypothetical protein